MGSFNFTKFLGVGSAALVVFVVLDRGAGLIYELPETAAVVYPLPAEPTDEAPAAEEAPRSLEELLASADASAGERVFKQCQACHKVEPGVHAVGPSLHAVAGRPVGKAEGFRYSGALDGTGDTWTDEALFAFLANPRAYAPGTTMSFNGVKDEAARADLIAYLHTLSD